MLTHIPVKFHDYRSNTYLATHDTSWKLQLFTKSRAITLRIVNKYTSKPTSAQLHHVHMLANISVKFYDFMLNVWATLDTIWKLQINSTNNEWIFKQKPRYTTTQTDQHHCKVSWLQVQNRFGLSATKVENGIFSYIWGNNYKYWTNP
jgi:hypothetical protein